MRTGSRLRAYYAHSRRGNAPLEPQACDALAAAMVERARQGVRSSAIAAPARSRRAPSRHDAQALAGFVSAQARSIGWWVWGAQAALVVVMAWLCDGRDPNTAPHIVWAFAAASVLVGLPGIARDKATGVAELAFACRFDFAAAALARLLVLGCTEALAVTVMAAVASSSFGVPLPQVLCWAALPYFLATAGGLCLVRRLSPSRALLGSLMWGVGVAAASLAFASADAPLYLVASTGVWMVAAAAAAVWAAAEAVSLVRAGARGLDRLAA